MTEEALRLVFEEVLWSWRQEIVRRQVIWGVVTIALVMLISLVYAKHLNKD